MIVIGLGTGRSGTASLAKLLNSQHNALCFHEMNPSCVRFVGTPRPILNSIDEFREIISDGDTSRLTVDLSRTVSAQLYDKLCRMRRVQLIGDIAFYYLTYVEQIAKHDVNVRFICLKRDRQETIESWKRKIAIPRWRSKHLADRIASMITREPFYRSHNFWMEHDGSVWKQDPTWDKCFPKFAASNMEDAIGQYWDMYYAEAERLMELLPGVFQIAKTAHLDDPNFQREILEFCGIRHSDQIYVDAHIHRSKT